jgi:hypothetical protein
VTRFCVDALRTQVPLPFPASLLKAVTRRPANASGDSEGAGAAAAGAASSSAASGVSPMEVETIDASDGDDNDAASSDEHDDDASRTPHTAPQYVRRHPA